MSVSGRHYQGSKKQCAVAAPCSASSRSASVDGHDCPVPGHLFVVQGDVRRIASAAWLLPCDFHGSVSPAWLEDDTELRARVDAFRPRAVAAFEDGRRVARLPGEERPHVWMVDTGGFPGTAESWYAEGLAEFVRTAAAETAADAPAARGRAVRRRRARRQGARQGDTAPSAARDAGRGSAPPRCRRCVRDPRPTRVRRRAGVPPPRPG